MGDAAQGVEEHGRVNPNKLHSLRERVGANFGTLEDVTAANSIPQITEREREVLTLIASGKSSKQIAAILGMAFKTAVSHRYHLQTKLNAHTTAALTLAAIRIGLIEP